MTCRRRVDTVPDPVGGIVFGKAIEQLFEVKQRSIIVRSYVANNSCTLCNEGFSLLIVVFRANTSNLCHKGCTKDYLQIGISST